MIISEKLNGFLRVSPRTLLRVTGEDALMFLQGQVTQELKNVPDGSAVYALWLSQKGRLVAESVIFRVTEQELWVLSYATPPSVMQERMDGYIVADDVTVENFSTGLSGLVAWGEDAVAWLQTQAEGSVAPGRFTRMGDGFVFPGRRGGEPTLDLISHSSPTLPAWGREVTFAASERVRILAGIPNVPEDLGAGELPNEGGLETSAISYTKGCYLGQETMARLKSLGQVRRKLIQIQGVGECPLTRPAALFQAGKRVGELRSVAAASQGGYVGFALVNLISFDAQRGLSLAVDSSPVISVLPGQDLSSSASQPAR